MPAAASFTQIKVDRLDLEIKSLIESSSRIIIGSVQSLFPQQHPRLGAQTHDGPSRFKSAELATPFGSQSSEPSTLFPLRPSTPQTSTRRFTTLFLSGISATIWTRKKKEEEEEECDPDEEHGPIAIVHDPGLQRYAVNVALNALSEAIKRSSNLTDRLAFGSLIYAVEIYPARCKDPYHGHFLR